MDNDTELLFGNLAVALDEIVASIKDKNKRIETLEKQIKNLQDAVKELQKFNKYIQRYTRYDPNNVVIND